MGKFIYNLGIGKGFRIMTQNPGAIKEPLINLTTGKHFLTSTDKKPQRKYTSLGPRILLVLSQVFQRQEHPWENQVMGCYPGTKAEPGSLTSSNASTKPWMFCHQAQPPNHKFSPLIASPNPLSPSVPSLLHLSPTHPHTCSLSPLLSTGGTIPLLRKSTPLLPANPSPPFLTFHYKFALQWATNH